MIRSLCIRALLGLAVVAIPYSLAVAQKPDAAKPEAAAKRGEEKGAAKRRGAVPAYYGKIVNDQQREKIYAIQAEYAGKIDKLEADIKALQASRDAAIEAVLTPEQQQQVAKAKAEAEKARKEKAGGDRKPEGEKKADAAPAKPAKAGG